MTKPEELRLLVSAPEDGCSPFGLRHYFGLRTSSFLLEMRAGGMNLQYGAHGG
jgi:hypothetical protein